MRYVVTGGAGFIGSNTVDELVRRGHRVTVFDDLSSGKQHNLARISDKIDFVQGTITDAAAVSAEGSTTMTWHPGGTPPSICRIC